MNLNINQLELNKVLAAQEIIKIMHHQYVVPTKLPLEPFRAYDIRGDTKFLTANVVYALGRAIATKLFETNQSTIILGRDGRLTSPELMQALQTGLLEMGVDIIDLGIVSSPMVYFATCNLQYNSGISLTASHNPKHHNGLKIIIDGKSLSEQQLQTLRLRAEQETVLAKKPGKVSFIDISQQYINTICEQIKLQKNHKVVVDCGNGAGSEIAPRVFAALGCEVVPLFCKIDGNFPNHHPDPGCPENLVDLQRAVIEHKADLGLAFDGDADRLGVVSGKGEIVWPDKQMIIFAQDVLATQPGAEIIFDVKCSNVLFSAIKKAGGKPVMWKTGHSLIKSKMRESNAPLAGEMSGHIFFGSPWFGFDDGVFAGARLLQYLDRMDQDLTKIIGQLPVTYSTHELKVPVAEADKSKIMQQLGQCMPDGGEVNYLDGLRLTFDNGWMLIRPSNTTPYLTVRYEANSQQDLKALKQVLLNWLHTACATLDLSGIS